MIQEGYKHLVGNTGYLLLKIPQGILDELKVSVDKIQNDFTQAIKVNDRLAGQIDKEYEIKLTNKATQYIRGATNKYFNHNPNHWEKITYQFIGKPPKLIYNGESWVNFQEKYEYNPLHKHDGVVSFVVWYQIPFYKANETKYGAGKGLNRDKSLNGDFSFTYYNGNSIANRDLSIDKTMEGYMVIFPSNLNHAVHPFYTSDDYRITISGNIHLLGQ